MGPLTMTCKMVAIAALMCAQPVLSASNHVDLATLEKFDLVKARTGEILMLLSSGTSDRITGVAVPSTLPQPFPRKLPTRYTKECLRNWRHRTQLRSGISNSDCSRGNGGLQEDSSCHRDSTSECYVRQNGYCP